MHSSRRLFCVDLKDYTNCHDYLKDVLKTNPQVDWNKITKNLVGTLPAYENQKYRLGAHNVDTFITRVVNSNKNASGKILLNFVHFLNSHNKQVALTTYDEIFEGLSKANFQYMSEKDLKIIKQICHQMLEKPDLPKAIHAGIMGTLANIGQVNEAFEIMKSDNNGNSLSEQEIEKRSLIILCSSAIQQNRPQEALELMKSDCFQGMLKYTYIDKVQTFLN